jgi:hypothetical protein
MLKKTISIALAISMFAVAFAALGVSAADDGPEGKLSARDSDGEIQGIFFPGEAVYFLLEYTFDGDSAAGVFTVSLIATGGGILAQVSPIYTGGVGSVDEGRNRSWLGGAALGVPGVAPGTYSLQALLVNTSDILCSTPIEIKNQAITVTPEQDIYAPGQTVNVKVTSTWARGLIASATDLSPKINITVGFSSVGDQSKGNKTLGINQTINVDTYEWNISWTIPENLTGQYPIWVNYSHDNTPIPGLAVNPLGITIEYFIFEVSTDKEIYLPGEGMVVSFVGFSVPDNTIVPITLDYEMWFMDAQTGKLNWKNYSGTTSLASSPSNVTLPAQANIFAFEPGVHGNIRVNTTAHWGNRTNNIAFDPMMSIRLGSLSTTISVDRMSSTYGPGEKILVTVGVRVSDLWGSAPVSGAIVDVKLYDDKGALVPALGLTNLSTGINGEIKGTIDVPLENMTLANDYMLVASASKLMLSAVGNKMINIQDNTVTRVLVDKTVYVGGDLISVVVKIWRNGVATTPDSIMYWLETCPDNAFTANVYKFSNMTMVGMAANVTVPSDMKGFGRIQIMPTVDGEKWGISTSIIFAIEPLILTLGVSKVNYYAGDTITFTVKVVGISIGYAMTYNIWDNELSPVANGVVTLDTDGEYVFTIEIPEVNPSRSYTARVIADNGDGSVLDADQTVTWFSAYLLDVKITTGPASTTGSYAPGQTIWLSFEVTKMSSDLPDLPVVTAYVELDSMFFGTVAKGEEMSFTGMKGEVSITIPSEATNGIFYMIVVSVWDPSLVLDADQAQQISVSNNEAGWEASWGGMSAANLLMTILMVAVIVMLLFMIMKKGGGAAVAPAEPKPAAPKAKEETYQPKSSVKCPSCGAMVEVATSKRPIEVMCPKCGTSQMVN